MTIGVTEGSIAQVLMGFSVVSLKFVDIIRSLRSRREHKAWGVSPRNESRKCPELAKASDRNSVVMRYRGIHNADDLETITLPPVFAGYCSVLIRPGVRCASPQALCWRLLRRLVHFFNEL